MTLEALIPHFFPPKVNTSLQVREMVFLEGAVTQVKSHITPQVLPEEET